MKRAMLNILLTTSLSWALQLAVPPSVWEISGTVRGDDGSPVSDAIISLTALPPYETKSRIRQWSVVTSIGGRFTLQGLYLGHFQTCVQVPGTAWLDPCRWGGGPFVVRLTNTNSTATTALTLRRGAALTLRVNDQSGLLDGNEGVTPGAHLLLGLTNDGGAWEPALPLSKDVAGRTYRVLVPFDRSLKIVVASRLFSLADGANVPLLPTGVTSIIPVTTTTGKTPPTVVVSVVGLGH